MSYRTVSYRNRLSVGAKKDFSTFCDSSNLEMFFVRIQIILKKYKKCECGCGCDRQKLRCGAEVRADQLLKCEVRAPHSKISRNPTSGSMYFKDDQLSKGILIFIPYSNKSKKSINFLTRWRKIDETVISFIS